MPLSTFYFHKIPLLFIISSVFATIFAFIIFALTIAFYLEYFSFGIIYPFIAKVLDRIAGLFTGIINWMDDLSFGTLEKIHLSSLQLFLFLAFGICLFLTLNYKRKWTYFLTLILLNVIIIESNFQISLPYENQLCFYSDQQKSRVDIFLDNCCYTLVADDLLDISPAFCNSNFRIKRGFNEIKPLVNSEETKKEAKRHMLARISKKNGKNALD